MKAYQLEHPLMHRVLAEVDLLVFLTSFGLPKLRLVPIKVLHQQLFGLEPPTRSGRR